MVEILAKHLIITPNCRRVQGGDEEAFKVAAARAMEEYARLLELRGPNDQAEYHLRLYVVRPD